MVADLTLESFHGQRWRLPCHHQEPTGHAQCPHMGGGMWFHYRQQRDERRPESGWIERAFLFKSERLLFLNVFLDVYFALFVLRLCYFVAWDFCVFGFMIVITILSLLVLICLKCDVTVN